MKHGKIIDKLEDFFSWNCDAQGNTGTNLAYALIEFLAEDNIEIIDTDTDTVITKIKEKNNDKKSNNRTSKNSI